MLGARHLLIDIGRKSGEFCGYAIPHTRSAGVRDLHVVIGTHPQSIMLKDDDAEPSKVIIMCLISKSTSNVYLLTPKAVCCYFLKPGVADRAAACGSPQELVDMLENDKVEISH